jgi:hypothetical protein
MWVRVSPHTIGQSDLDARLHGRSPTLVRIANIGDLDR